MYFPSKNASLGNSCGAEMLRLVCPASSGEDRIGRDLAARARRRRDVHHGEHVALDGMGEDVADLLPRAQGDRLGRVHGRVAARRDDKVRPERARQRAALFDARDGGVGLDLVVDGERLPVPAEGVGDVFERAVF